MIENFETVKKELKELAGVINAFKSEAVQLRIVEIILGASDIEDGEPQKASRRKKKKKAASQPPKSNGKKDRKKTTAAGTGAVATVTMLAEGDFFSKPRTINDIIQHCSTNLARNFKANEFSGKLGRMVRNGELKRQKNSDNQYEYAKA